MPLTRRALHGGAWLLILLGWGGGCGGRKSPSEPTPVCSFTIAPASHAFGADGGTATVAVTTASACAWTVASGASWIVVTGGANGTGPGTVAYAVASNGSPEARNSTMTIAGQSHAVTQQGRVVTPCTYQLSPGSAQFTKDAGTGTFGVTAPAGCAWTAASNAAWLSVSSGSPGSGNGTVAYAVTRNLDPGERSAAIAVADRTFTVRQAGDAGVCSYVVAPTEFTPCMPKGSVTARVTTAANCPWTAAAGASWLGVSSGRSGSGSGNIVITFTDNYDAPRNGVVMVRWPAPTAGQNIQVAQAGCVYGVSQSAIAVPAAGGPGSFDVVQQSIPNECGGALQDRCVWAAASDVPWITVTSSMPRTGDNPVAFTVAPNGGTAPRVGHIAVRDKVVTITQAAP